MQPEPTTSSPRQPNPVNESISETSAQYGFSAPDDDDSSPRERLDVATSQSPAGPSAEPGSSPGLGSRLAGLSLEDERKKRISEYENALLSSPPKRQLNEGPGFKVVKKKGGKNDGTGNGLQLDEFPNEVLTHILSHLPAASLSAVSTVSKRFYSLVTTPHAWRIAFSRFFPGQDTSFNDDDGEQLRSEHRVFTRLTGLASWRSEYILRTRLLRSLGRGKPAQLSHGASSRSNSAANNANAVVTYSSQLFATVNHIHGVFGTGKKATRFMHGTDETGSACTSDPNIGKIDNWGLSDPQALPQFADLFVGDEPYGMGEGPVGLPNSMDVSVPFGMVYGEGFPGGQTYFRSSEEMRGRFISQANDLPDSQAGIPTIPGLTEAVSAVWIAKSGNVPQATNGLVGIMTGSTLGIVTTYSLGADTSHGRRITRGQVTAKWVLSPGVPIIALKVDDEYSLKRRASGRIWAVALNALGEVFCLSETPASALVDNKVEDGDAGRHAWNAGRTAYWTLVEPSRRVAKDDPYNEAEIHGSYSPRSSSKFMRLSKAQVVAETLEIEKFLAFLPVHFRKLCDGWDMRRRLEVDFAGDDGNGAGEAMFVINCGIEEGQQAEMKRFTRWKTEQASREEYPTPKTPPMAPRTVTMASLFGGGLVITPPRNSSPERSQMTSLVGSPIRRISPDRSPSMPSSPSSRTMSTTLVEEWRTSILSLKDHPNIEITTSAIDMSTYATLTVDEDPLRTVNGQSEMSSPFGTPVSSSDRSTQIPGHRARFLAIGTKVGTVIVYNMRAPQSSTPSLPNTIHPLRTIVTDSPQISTLALSALYLIHGGNDGLVQTWDPLSSSQAPIRTLNSRFSSRARRRLVQAEASALGVGINLYAAGSICLDPDPTVLRGMVSLGTHLRFWSYSSSAADAYQSKKRRLRRSNERGSNSAPDRFTNTGRGALMDYIVTEQEELKKEKMRRAREEARLRGRFGVGLSGMSEDEALRYAELISAETYQKDEERRMSDVDAAIVDSTPEGSVRNPRSPVVDLKTDDELEHDIEEAIRLSLLQGVDAAGRSPSPRSGGAFDGPITYKTKKSPRSHSARSESSSPSHSRSSGKRNAGSSGSKGVEADDLELALQLSLAEERSRAEIGMNGEEFPKLEVRGKGKGRAG